MRMQPVRSSQSVKEKANERRRQGVTPAALLHHLPPYQIGLLARAVSDILPRQTDCIRGVSVAFLAEGVVC